ncbi:T9SS type A sorting domain-containing protein [Neptunitalea lumnitzerae]|uniref:Secretion system C-terminal sorting domain-containing protein n=1 Tax=Neptunitalea lumnitzerae TaxID=2965509 RepID=A0ABQ5MK78_9FLAO|nr:T9SS type A sorting domain-containing protein [Neptunitalea sp. Y10]GLB49810.1 hypothetical protein Y10_21780 [Neptunitalea sp. Y10]
MFLFISCFSLSYAQLDDLIICDDYPYQDIGTFNLTINNDIFLSGDNPNDYSITYYTSFTDADTGVNFIYDPTAYMNETNPQTIYARKEENSSGIYEVQLFSIIVNQAPQMDIHDAVVCSDAFPYQINTVVDNGNYSYEWYWGDYIQSETSSTLLAQIPGHYSVVMTDNITGCSRTFNSWVYSINCDLPDLTVCDDDIADGIALFDLTDNETLLLNGNLPTSLNISYYATENDAMAAVNVLPTSYYNVIPYIQTIYVRTESLNNEFNVTTFDLIVNPSPFITFAGAPFICNDGTATNLEVNLPETDYTFEWYQEGTTLPQTTASLDIYTPGNYSVIVTNNSNCQSQYDFVIEQIDCQDSDNDGIPDVIEDLNGNGNLDDDDTDGDSIANYLDDDDYNDGVLTINEDYNNNSYPGDDDTNNNGLRDYLEAAVALDINSVATAGFEIYPNPATTLVTITSKTPIDAVTVYTLNGKIIELPIIKTSNKTSRINVNSLQSGLYIIKVTAGGTATNQKLLVK